MSRLFYKYLIPLLLLAVIPVIVTGFMFYLVLDDNIRKLEQNLIDENSKVLQEEISSKNENIAHSEGLSIELEIDRIGNKLTTLTLSPDFIDFNKEAIDLFISNIIASEPAVIKGFVVNEFGEVILKREGFIALGTEDTPEFLFDSMQNTLSSRRSFISEILHSNNNQSSYVLIAQPVIDMAGNFKGGCAFEIDLSFLNNYLLSSQIDENSILYLVSSQGKLISHPSPKELSQNTDYSKYDYIQKLLKSESGTLIREQTLISFYRNKYNWTTIVEIPIEQALKSIKNNRESILSFTRDTINSTILTTSVLIIFMLVLTVLIGIYFTNKITQPLETLIAASEKISSGDLNLKALPVRSNDEIGRLTKAFNIMTQEMLKSRKELMLTNEKIKEQAEALRKRYNSDLEQFAYVTTHDLIEPLRMITSYVQLIQRRYKDVLNKEKSKNYFSYVEEGVMRMHLIISDLFEYTHIRTELSDIEQADLTKVINTVKQKLEQEIDSSKAVIKITRALPVIIADESNMVQLFQNLIANAIKFRAEKTPEITINFEEKKNEYLFSVADNGIGFDPIYTNKIFDIFKRLHSRDTYKGSGMGLAICKNIVERHGGRIWAESQLGKGATFYFTIKKL